MHSRKNALQLDGCDFCCAAAFLDRLCQTYARLLKTHEQKSNSLERLAKGRPVLKWEKSKGHAIVMNWTTEKDIRLFVLTRLAAPRAESEMVELFLLLRVHISHFLGRYFARSSAPPIKIPL